jgi:hypothetical protein
MRLKSLTPALSKGVIVHEKTESLIGMGVQKTHPVCASLDHPLLAYGGKRVGKMNKRQKKNSFTLFPAKLKRGSTSAEMSG